MDFLTGQIVFKTNPIYDGVYDHFRDQYEVKFQHMFLFCAAIGARNSHSIPFTGKGREIRSNYFTSDERNLLYSIILNDESKGKDLEKFEDNTFYSEARKLLESYAEGGMEILVKEVFTEKWDGVKLDSAYTDYSTDLLTYVASALKNVPF
ncbi:hypothetical protein [Bacillus cereus]|jgi:hypothetical protein|uniref:hypothetical protein n=1 Tax=Bacillus cereus TaxID=1396 RepID=UPI000BF297A7|nr:hypothetical protein [Bacillus cereus]PFM32268.1 hypothetical protein COJ47_13520 [Bacillus cereus]